MKLSKITVSSFLAISILGNVATARDAINIAGPTHGKQTLRVDEKERSLQWDTDIVKKNKNSESYCQDTSEEGICFMDYYMAKKYCEDHGKRLPTITELVKKYHPQAFSETASNLKNLPANNARVKGEIKKMKSIGYDPIYTQNSAKQTVVDFYFNETKDYTPPSEISGKYLTWSSTPKPVSDGSDISYVLDSNDGKIESDARSYPHATVQCVWR